LLYIAKPLAFLVIFAIVLEFNQKGANKNVLEIKVSIY